MTALQERAKLAAEVRAGRAFGPYRDLDDLGERAGHARTLRLLAEVLGIDTADDDQLGELMGPGARSNEIDPRNRYVMLDDVWFFEQDGRLWAQSWQYEGVGNPHEAPIASLADLGTLIAQYPPYCWHYAVGDEEIGHKPLVVHDVGEECGCFGR